jgi:hypothetical protein
MFVKWIATLAVVVVAVPTTVFARGPIASSEGPDYGVGCTFFDEENFQGFVYFRENFLARARSLPRADTN